MNRKKYKQEYDVEGVKSQLKKLIIDENIITNQKCYIYTQLKTYKELYLGLQSKYKDLENENMELYKQINCKLTTNKENTDNSNLKNIITEKCDKENCNLNSCNSENCNKENCNTEIDDTINMTENIKNKLKEYSNRITDQYDDEHISIAERMTNYRNTLREKDEKIVELENTILKFQILNRTNNIKNDTEEDIDENEVINLKTRVEYAQIEKERLIINSNNRIMESKIKYEEFMRKYEKLNENFNNLLVRMEDLKNIIKEKDKKKIDQILELEKKMEDIKSDVILSTEKLNSFIKNYEDIKNLFALINKQNYNLIRSLKSYKIFEDKKNNKTGEEFFDEEIGNLLEVCDTLTEDNKKLNINLLNLEQKLKNLEIEKSRLESEKEALILKSKTQNILKYVDDLNQQKKLISEHLQEIKNLTEEKNKLIRLNVDRIKVSDKYKDELRIKSIENVCLEKKNEDIEKMINETKEEIFSRLRSNKKSEEVSCVICTLCDTNPKNVAIVSCMHTFCENCINLRIKLRDRKCPTCGNSFHVSDVKRLYL